MKVSHKHPCEMQQSEPMCSGSEIKGGKSFDLGKL